MQQGSLHLKSEDLGNAANSLYDLGEDIYLIQPWLINLGNDYFGIGDHELALSKALSLPSVLMEILEQFFPKH